jgi:hypothetical protein
MVLGCLEICVGVVLLIHDPDSLRALFPILVFGPLLLLILWGRPRWAARRQFTKQPLAQGPRTMKVSDGGIHWEWQGGNSDVQWTNFIRVVDSKYQILLYASPAYFVMVPKRVLTPEQLAEFCSFVSAKVPSRN